MNATIATETRVGGSLERMVRRLRRALREIRWQLRHNDQMSGVADNQKELNDD